MAYTYDSEYDSYPSRPLSRSMSRQKSIGYSGIAYPHSSYSDGVPVTNYHTAYQLYGHPSSALVSASRRGHSNQYYDSSMAIGRSLSRTPSTRSRRHSTVSFANYGYGAPSTMHVKFKRKSSFSSGIGLNEAQQRILKLSNNDSYSFHDLHADSHRRIYIKIKWTGYSALTYEIPLAGYDRVDLQTLARRISRACVHYLQANVIPVPWDRVILHHLEEVQYGAIWAINEPPIMTNGDLHAHSNPDKIVFRVGKEGALSFQFTHIPAAFYAVPYLIPFGIHDPEQRLPPFWSLVDDLSFQVQAF